MSRDQTVPECHCPKSAQTCFDQTLRFHAGTEMTQVCNLVSFYQLGRKEDINLSWKVYVLCVFFKWSRKTIQVATLV